MKLKLLPKTLLTVAILCCCGWLPAHAQWKLNEGFEGGVIPSTWKIHDVNADNNKWKASNKPAYAHGGEWIAFVEAYSGTGLKDILVTPQIAISQGDVLNFHARSWFGVEDLTIKISVTGNAVNDFKTTLATITDIGTTYQEFTYDLSSWAGQNIYVGFHWNRRDYAMVLDDIKVGRNMPADIGVWSSGSPAGSILMNEAVNPNATLKNFGAGDITDPFVVSCLISDSDGSVVYSNNRTFSRPITAGSNDTVMFPTWVPQTEGTYSVKFYTALAEDADTSNDTLTTSTEVVRHYGTGGPDLMSYQWIDSFEENGPEYNWIEISETGESVIMYGVNQFSGDDNISEAIPIGFDFPFYGINRNYFYTDINGTLFLADPVNWRKPYPALYWEDDGNIFNYMYTLPGYKNMPALVSVFWDDLEATEGTGDIYFQNFGLSPNQYVVIQWNNLKFRAGTGTETLCFQAILHENGEIILQYKNVATGQANSVIPHDFGQSASIGIQNDDWATGLGYLNEIVVNNEYQGVAPYGNLLRNETAIKFFVGEDTQGPVISHKRTWNTFADNMQLTANMIDPNGVSADTLFYTYGSGWQSMSHDSIVGTTFYYNLEEIPIGTTVQYFFVSYDASGNANRSQFDIIDDEALTFNTLPSAEAKTIILSPGYRTGYPDHTAAELNVYRNKLDSLGIQYDVYNYSVFGSFRIPESYNIAIAYHNNAVSNDIVDTLSRALIEFMDMGTAAQPKNVFVAGDEFAQAQHSLSNDKYFKQLMAGYVRAGYEVQPNPPIFGGTDGFGGPDLSGDQNGTIKAMANSPIGVAGTEVSAFADSPDVIYARTAPDWMVDMVVNPLRSSTVAYRFEDGPIDGDAYSKGNAAAVWLNNDVYKSFFISFNMSTLDSIDANQMLQEAMVWFSPESYLISISADPADAGTVTGGGEYVEGSTATVTAVANEGFAFENWNENGEEVSTNSVYSFPVNGAREIIASFDTLRLQVTANAFPIEGGTITGAGIYNYGSTATLTAEANEGFVFENWKENGEVVSTDNVYSFAVTSAKDITASFHALQLEVTANALPLEGGTITGTGLYNYGSTVTLLAEAAEDFIFINWTVDGVEVSAEPAYTFVITEEIQATANFSSTVGVIGDSYKGISIQPNPATDYVLVNKNGLTVARMDLYSASGFVRSYGVTAERTQYLNISDLTKGIYFLRVVFVDGSVITRKLIHL